MKIVFAPDSFKGSLTAEQICGLLEEKAKLVFPDCHTISLPVSDGGEGAAEVVISALKGRLHSVMVHDPMGRQIQAVYGSFHKDCAVIEMASASGLPLVLEKDRNIRRANTFGTGELIVDALDKGVRNFYIAIGGSATNDGGIGCAAALGIRFLDEKGEALLPIPENLGKIKTINQTNIHPAVKKAEFTVMCDVTNPLLGEKGASYIFGPQKGASHEDILFLEKGLKNYADVLHKTFGRDFSQVSGAGAAGGLGAGLMAFTGAKLKRGVECILSILDFDHVIQGADLIVTGEGRMDHQSAYGKVLYGVGMAAKKQKIPCVAVVGSIGDGADCLYEYGISSAVTTINAPMTIEEALKNAEELFGNAAERMFRMIDSGIQIKQK